VRAEILEQIRHAGERSIGQARDDGGPGLIVQSRHHGVELGIARLHAGDGRVEELGRARITGAHQPGQAEPIVALEFFSLHWSSWALLHSRGAVWRRSCQIVQGGSNEPGGTT
jgi:hypothetical protein